MTNKEYAQKILRIIGNVTVSSDAIYQLAKEAYHKLGGSETEPDLDTIYQYLKAAIDIYDETEDLNITQNGTYELLGKTINVDVEATPNEPFRVFNSNGSSSGQVLIRKICPTAVVEVSYNGANWYEIGANNTGLFNINIGVSSVIFIRGIMDESVTNLTTAQFYFENPNYIWPVFYGNIMNLYDYRNPENKILKIPYCFAGMFTRLRELRGCYIKLPATTLTEYCYKKMFFILNNYYLNENTLNVELPATTLARGCYEQMFYGLPGLKNAPELPAKTLVDSCYKNMFGFCTNLNKVVTYAEDISAANCTFGWLENVSSTGDFYNLGGATWSTGKNGIPTGWTEHRSL